MFDELSEKIKSTSLFYIMEINFLIQMDFFFQNRTDVEYNHPIL